MAGILVPAHSALGEAGELQRRIETVNVHNVPWEHLPWIHTAHVKVPVTLPLAHYFRELDNPDPPQPDDAECPAESVTAMAEELAQWLSDRPAIHYYLEAAGQDFAIGRLPRLEHLKKINAELKSHGRDLYYRVRNFAANVYAQLELVVRTLPRDIRVIVTSEDGQGAEQWAGENRVRGTARHFKLMRCLFERASDVIAGQRGQHRIFLKIATLNVYEAGGPRQGVQLNVQRLEELVGDLELPGNVTLQACEPIVFDAGVHGTIVAADFIVNRAWCRRLLECQKSLAGVERDFFWLPRHRIHSGTPRLSHLAATGWPESCVNAARRCAAAAEPPPGVKPWAASQAQGWANYLRTHCPPPRGA